MEVVKGAEFLLGSVPCALGPRELCTCLLRHPHKISFFTVCSHPNPGSSNPGQVLGGEGIAHYPHFRSPNRRGLKSNSETKTPQFKSCGCVLSHSAVMSNSVTQWTTADQAPLSMGFSRQEHWSGLPCPPPGDLPDPGIESTSFMSPALAGGFFTTSTTLEAPVQILALLFISHMLLGNLSLTQFPHL